VVAEVPAPASVVGPPHSVAVAPDESFALVTAATVKDPADPKKVVPGNRLSVIDLRARPPAVIATVETGAGPAGVSINPAGTLALVANRGEGTVSVFRIAGTALTPAGKVDLGNPRSGPSHAAFTPDGRMALLTRDGDHKISILSVDADKVDYTRRDLTGGIRPYGIQVSPKGDIAVVGNQGGGTGDVDTLNVIDLKGKAPRIVDTISVGQIVEGVAFSADGRHVAVTAMEGSNRAAAHPFYGDRGLAIVYRVDGTKLTRVADARIGKWNQGIVWSRDGRTLLAQNMVEEAISVLSFDGSTLTVTGEIKVKGGPAGLRTAER
jgi:DNA-binding beta-propeller fold protein YncE